MERLDKKFTDRIARERGVNVVPIKSNETEKRPEKLIPKHVSQPCFTLGNDVKFPYSLRLQQEDGEILKSMDYVQLKNKHYERDLGIILFYADATVTIYGDNLDELYKRLDDRRVSAISVYNGSSIQINDNFSEYNEEQSIVTKIDVKYKDQQIQKEIEEMRRNAFKNKGNSSHNR